MPADISLDKMIYFAAGPAKVPEEVSFPKIDFFNIE